MAAAHGEGSSTSRAQRSQASGSCADVAYAVDDAAARRRQQH
eukprot:COSAG01_NODE_4684_length_4814_cov_11.714952_5_plen_42_part_00